MLTEILRTQQPLFFSRHGGEVHGVGRTLGRLRERAREFEKDAAAGAVVGGAVVDAICLRVGIDAEMIVVGGVKHRVFSTGSRTGNARYHVGGIVFADAAFNMGLEADVESLRMKSALAGPLDPVIKVAEPGKCE